MGRWLARALSASAPDAIAPEAVPNVSKVPKVPAALSFGTFGTIGTRPEVPREEVAALLDWTANRLASDRGLAEIEARRKARAIVAAALRNDPRLTPDQPNQHRCLVCNERDGPSRPLVPVLTPKPDFHVWLHAGSCHAEYRQRQSAKVAALLGVVASVVTGANAREAR